MKSGKISQYPELVGVLRDHALRLQETLGDFMIGVYLVGSLAIGDFDLTSDIDFIVVTSDELSESQVNRVQSVHDRTYRQDNRWVKQLEYSFFPKDMLNHLSSPFSRHGRTEGENRELWHFCHGSPTLERSDHDNSLVVRWTLREKAVVVIGPDPTALLNSVSANALRTEVRNTLVGWGRELLADAEPYGNRFFQAFIVLHFCRMLQDQEEGRVTSKLEGAEWAKAKLDPKWIPLIEYCWNDRQDSEIHVSQPAVPEIFDEVLAFVKSAVVQSEGFITS
jgi:predicted nucleotidyltransferase